MEVAPDTHALAFARTPAKEKATILRAILPRLAAAAPELCALACQSRGIDPDSDEAGAAWLHGAVPLIANVRALAESLEEIAGRGRPRIPSPRLGKHGRAALTVKPRHFAERVLSAGVQAELRFEEGARPDEVIAAQASVYRQPEPEGSLVEIPAPISPVMRHFAPSSSSSSRVAPRASRRTRRAHPSRPCWRRPSRPSWIAARSALPPRRSSLRHRRPPARRAATSPRGSVVPYPYAADELGFQAKSVASALVLQRSFDRGTTRVLVLADGWEQRELFLELIARALAALPARDAFALTPLDPALLDEPPSSDSAARVVLPVVTVGTSDPAQFLATAVPFVNERAQGGRGATITVHPSQEDDLLLEPVIDEAIQKLRYGAVAINASPSLIRARPALPWGAPPDAGNALMLSRVEKVILRAPLWSPLKPA